MDLPMLVDHLQQAQAHVALGEQHIAQQRKLLARLTANGSDTRQASSLLSLFEETQQLHVADRDRLAKMLAQRTETPRR